MPTISCNLPDSALPKGHLTVRSGFTLLEMMLVLTIIVVIGSIGVPMADGVMARQKLRGSADELRMVWQSARLTAMRTGQAQVFNCVVGTNNFSVQPLMLGEDAINVSEEAIMDGSGVAAQTISSPLAMSTPASDAGQIVQQQIDSTLTFFSCVAARDMRAELTMQAASAGNLGTREAGQPVIFYPDGSTSTAELLIKSSRDEVCGVQIRGLTGHSQILALTAAEALEGR